MDCDIESAIGVRVTEFGSVDCGGRSVESPVVDQIYFSETSSNTKELSKQFRLGVFVGDNSTFG